LRLPNHLHAVWSLPQGDADFSLRWSLIKSGFSRRYWEHAIRDDADLERRVDYIHFNPVKHGSFHRYVARGVLPPDWGGRVRDTTGAFGE
jgi:putative transposase